MWKGVKAFTVLFLIAMVAAVLLLFSALGAVGGGSVSRAAEAVGIILLLVSVISYYAVIPYLIVVSMRARKKY
jgi:hypothetical protein